MEYPVSPVPEIHISFAPPDEPRKEPYSPFASLSPLTQDDDDGYRPTLLSPPCTASPKVHRQLSPLRPADAPVGKGLDRDRFEALLRSSRERNTAVGAKKSLDLRKEIALKAHKSKQMERRAVFLSKIQAPPSPTATGLPKTPPESPAIFHYTLPSPGLVSPLAVFESIQENPSGFPAREPWVEQVDFRLPKEYATQVKKPMSPSFAKPLPSLDQITAHLSSHGHVAPQREPRATRRSPIPLPDFLRGRVNRQKSPARAEAPAPKPRRNLPIGVGRLQFPARNTVPAVPEPVSPQPQHLHQLPPRSPGAPLTPKITITTTVVPRTSTTSPVDLTESNLQALTARARKASDMLSTLRRRTVELHLDAHSLQGLNGRDVEDDRKSGRRHSAPAELVQRRREGFMHPVLDLPGGF
ncbi:hypothetical protein GLOTRDRAFT_113401 [Gloeophyllum trabeum ATCC 11539]|uniref:Uncharacterized protein n=1 Tax=Gloeophyllum trabeum (strain ATCC 11539 / FP-39264 / Madison 617) TaxID=670483 RepID=S7QN18_GLOTA|nr:uncharacterized protein GLOTRDRAFT_113401 [Gloeophyllum trabeum ATCC 11539]EPQ60888.1 hypothetical protein GLOTRDRAFT_113401 [Gloeophyllum trabeum ATCC 11539]